MGFESVDSGLWWVIAAGSDACGFFAMPKEKLIAVVLRLSAGRAVPLLLNARDSTSFLTQTPLDETCNTQGLKAMGMAKIAGLTATVAVVMFTASKWRAVRRQMVERDEAQREFLNDWGERLSRLEHDMRTPIGTLACAVELVETEQEGPLRTEALEVIARQLTRMTAHAESLRSIAQQLKR